METRNSFKVSIVLSNSYTKKTADTDLMTIKENIIEKAKTLFMQYGIRSVSMDDIASDLGISKKTIYQYFENKSDLIHQVTFLHIQQDLDAFNQIRNDSSNSIEELLKFASYLMVAIRNISPTAVYDLQKYYKESWAQFEEVHKQYIYSTIKGNIERGQAQGLYRQGINPDIAARLYVSTSHLVMDEDIFPMNKYRKDTIIKEFIYQSVHGWASDKGLELWKEHIAIEEQKSEIEN